MLLRSAVVLLVLLASCSVATVVVPAPRLLPLQRGLWLDTWCEDGWHPETREDCVRRPA